MLLPEDAEVAAMVEGCTDDDGNPDGGRRDEHRFRRVIRLKSVHRDSDILGIGNTRLPGASCELMIRLTSIICPFSPAFFHESLFDLVSNGKVDK